MYVQKKCLYILYSIKQTRMAHVWHTTYSLIYALVIYVILAAYNTTQTCQSVVNKLDKLLHSASGNAGNGIEKFLCGRLTVILLCIIQYGVIIIIIYTVQ